MSFASEVYICRSSGLNTKLQQPTDIYIEQYNKYYKIYSTILRMVKATQYTLLCTQRAKWGYLTWDAVNGCSVLFCLVDPTYQIRTAQPEQYAAGKIIAAVPFCEFWQHFQKQHHRLKYSLCSPRKNNNDLVISNYGNMTI